MLGTIGAPVQQQFCIHECRVAGFQTHDPRECVPRERIQTMVSIGSFRHGPALSRERPARTIRPEQHVSER